MKVLNTMLTKLMKDSYRVLQQDAYILEKILKGLLFLILSIFIIPMFIYQGYLLKILEKTANRDTMQLPKWENYGELFKYGLVSVLFTIIGYILLIPFGAGMYLFSESTAVLIILGLLAFVTMLIYGYLLFGIYTLYVRDETSLSLQNIKKIALSKTYLEATLGIFLISFIVGFINLIVSIVTFGVGPILLIPFIPPINYLVMVLVGFSITEIDF